MACEALFRQAFPKWWTTRDAATADISAGFAILEVARGSRNATGGRGVWGAARVAAIGVRLMANR